MWKNYLLLLLGVLVLNLFHARGKTIMGDHGEVVECVDIYSQPALRHPLLRDHKIQMNPVSLSSKTEQSNSSPKLMQHWHKNDMCAVGTVPITRRRKVLDVPSLNESSDARQVPHYEFAKVHHTLLRSNGGSRLYGGSALLSIWEPVVARPSDLSASSMIVSITPGVFLEAGWIVYTKRYGDSRPRLFIYWTIDNNLNRCWDMDCDGFVQVNNTVALGSPLEEVSTISGVKHVFRLTIHQDALTKNWWLRLGGSLIGYWPASLFPSDIADGAEGLEWGGEVFDSIGRGQHTETDMGNGLFPNSDNASYVCALRYVDESLMLQIPDMSMLRVLVTNPKCYNARIIPITDEERGPCFLYGGSGLNPECP